MESLDCDREYYDKCFETYLKISDRCNGWMKWIGAAFSENIFPEFNDGSDHLGVLKMLGIGCSSGIIDYDFVCRWSKHYPKVVNTVLEPSAAIEEYQALVKDKPISGITWNWHRQTWHEFSSERQQNSEKYHFISAISVLYYMKNWRKEVMNMYECLEDGGLLAISIAAEHCRCWKLPELFPELKTNATEDIHSGEIEAFLKTKNITFNTIKPNNAIDVSSCFEDGSTNGRMLLDFLAHVKHFEQTAPPTMVSKFKDCMRNGECTRRENGQILLDNSSNTIIVKKVVSN